MTALPWHQTELERLAGDRSRMPHALLVRGRRGTGKQAFARALSRALLCESVTASGLACGQCLSCGWMESAAHPDFRLVEPAGAAEDDGGGTDSGSKRSTQQITIDQIRGLADFINISSHRGGQRVVLIQPAEALNANAANALLKSLEEPPAGVCFILVTHRVHFLLPTIVSRCRQVTLPDPGLDAAMAWLTEQGVPEPALALAQAGYSPLLAQEYAAKDYWQRREFLLRRMADTALDPLQLAEQIRDYAVPDVLGWLQKWTFDLIHSKCAGGVRYNPDYADDISRIAHLADSLQVLRFHRQAIRMQRVIHHPLNTRLLYEQLLIDYAGLLRPVATSPHGT